MNRLNEWGREHPWQAAAATALFLFVFLMAFGMTVLGRDAAGAFPYSAAYAVTFSVLTGAINSYRRRRDGS